MPLFSAASAINGTLKDPKTRMIVKLFLNSQEKNAEEPPAKQQPHDLRRHDEPQVNATAQS